MTFSHDLSLVSEDDRRAVIAALLQEKENRRLSIFSHFAQWRDDPLGFIEHALLGFLWSKQREIVESVRVHRRTAVQSCHDVGKSAVIARVFAWWLSCNEPGQAFGVTLAPTLHQVRGILWREINRVHAGHGLPGYTNQTEWWVDKELVGFGRSPADTDPTAIQGQHAAKVLVAVDEACGVARAIIDAADTLITNEDSRIVLIGNPDDPDTYFGEVCRPGSGWNVIRISAFESPNFTGEEVPKWLRKLLVSRVWVEEKKKSWGVGSILYTSKVLGEFPEQSTDSLIPAEALRQAHARYVADRVPGDEDGPNELGIDVARMGDDRSVFYRRKGWRAFLEHQHRKRDLMELVGHVVRLCRKDKPLRVKVDDTGMGGGVSDRLREMKNMENPVSPGEIEAKEALAGVEIVPINVGEGAESIQADERFKNKRAEINWMMRMHMTDDNPRIAIEPNDTLDAEIMQVKYKPLSTGEIQIEKKADMKKRTKGASPDMWDALCLAFASPSFPGAGLMEWYRRNAEAQQKSAEEAKAAKGAPSLSTGGVRLKAPPDISTVYGMTGTVYQVVDGEIVVSADDAKPLLTGQGFEKL